MNLDSFEKIEITTPQTLWHWLGENHGGSTVWLVTWKAAYADKYVSRNEVLDALIAHGWIDGRRMKLDDARTMQLISPRKQQIWAATYIARANQLQAKGRMHPAGLAVLARDRASGVFDSLADVDNFVVPETLLRALEQRDALAWWQAAAPSYRRNVLRWIALAKRPETQTARINTVADHAARGQKVPQY